MSATTWSRAVKIIERYRRGYEYRTVPVDGGTKERLYYRADDSLDYNIKFRKADVGTTSFLNWFRSRTQTGLVFQIPDNNATGVPHNLTVTGTWTVEEIDIDFTQKPSTAVARVSLRREFDPTDTTMSQWVYLAEYPTQ